jgi:hypothetical protein
MAQPGRAPTPPDRRTSPPVSGSALSRAPSLPRPMPSGADLSTPISSHARPSSLSALRARIASHRAVAPSAPLFYLCAVGLPCQLRPLRVRRGPARAHSRTSPDFLATTPTHEPSSLLRAPPVPRARPSPHFAHPHPLSRSVLAARRRRRPAPAFVTP